ncbi:hypothetical protein GlitD10_0869 [Gloeomargarita lithophora Alchichica-D10]|uniref:Uncharacterized protein n=1 Tax=Gloeomargarita lithophora Alchichica-D10 TaxID=1188229 RepID=A0A1J0ABA6_9CYAN|nr:hypothetical protein [Gloeomargarita lithophora]APB33185.1 hypothetical protein GlitD10_0869 [Gloeomargarita lithophora Alchichica-D10]
MALFMLRELDFDKRLRIMEIFNGQFYVGHSLPFTEKILALVSFGFLLYIIIFTLCRHAKSFLIGLKQGSCIAQGVLIVIFLLFLSNFIDGVSRKLNIFGFTISPATFVYFNAIEEVLELGISMISFITIDAYFRQIKARQTHVLPARRRSR